MGRKFTQISDTDYMYGTEVYTNIRHRLHGTEVYSDRLNVTEVYTNIRHRLLWGGGGGLDGEVYTMQSTSLCGG